MTRKQFEKLKVGDGVIAYGCEGIVTKKSHMCYILKSKYFDDGDGICEVSFAWNEGEPL